MPKRTCSIDGCERVVRTRGWCNRHYQRWLNHGDPISGRLEIFHDPEEAFAARTKWSGGCLIWTGAKGPLGYGSICVKGSVMSPHRYSWERKNGPIPKGIEINHRCWNPECVNVEHLELATREENTSYHQGPNSDNRSSGVRNVSKVGGRWRVRVKKSGAVHNFGYYSTLEEAAGVAEQARRELFGHFAGNG